MNPALSNVRREKTAGTEPAASARAQNQEKSECVALKGDLSEIGLLDVIQILDNAQKNGKLLISSEGQEGVIYFNSGRIVNACYQNKTGEQAMYALVGVKGGTFDYQPSDKAFEMVINNNNTNLLLEGLRLLDEANRDLSESEICFEQETANPSESETESGAGVPASLNSAYPPPPMTPPPLRQYVTEENPLEDL